MGINRGLLHSSRGPLRGKMCTCLLPGCLELSLYRSAAIYEVAVGFMGDEASKSTFMLSSSAWFKKQRAVFRNPRAMCSKFVCDKGYCVAVELKTFGTVL